MSGAFGISPAMYAQMLQQYGQGKQQQPQQPLMGPVPQSGGQMAPMQSQAGNSFNPQGQQQLQQMALKKIAQNMQGNSYINPMTGDLTQGGIMGIGGDVIPG